MECVRKDTRLFTDDFFTSQRGLKIFDFENKEKGKKMVGHPSFKTF